MYKKISNLAETKFKAKSFRCFNNKIDGEQDQCVSSLSAEAKELTRLIVGSAKSLTRIRQIQTSIYLNLYEEPSYILC